MKTLTGHKTMGQLIAHGDNFSIADCWTKNSVIFELFCCVSKCLCISFMVSHRTPNIVVQNPGRETLFLGIVWLIGQATSALVDKCIFDIRIWAFKSNRATPTCWKHMNFSMRNGTNTKFHYSANHKKIPFIAFVFVMSSIFRLKELV
jgi:hypothetical protein